MSANMTAAQAAAQQKAAQAAANAFNVEVFTLLGVGVLVVAARTISRTTMVGIKGLWAEYVPVHRLHADQDMTDTFAQ
jgi:hypothetical protein